MWPINKKNTKESTRQFDIYTEICIQREFFWFYAYLTCLVLIRGQQHRQSMHTIEILNQIFFFQRRLNQTGHNIMQITNGFVTRNSSRTWTCTHYTYSKCAIRHSPRQWELVIRTSIEMTISIYFHLFNRIDFLYYVHCFVCVSHTSFDYSVHL